MSWEQCRIGSCQRHQKCMYLNRRGCPENREPKSLIVRSDHAVRYIPSRFGPEFQGEWRSGLRVVLFNGEVWFHPYSGQDPIKLQEEPDAQL